MKKPPDGGLLYLLVFFTSMTRSMFLGLSAEMTRSANTGYSVYMTQLLNVYAQDILPDTVRAPAILQ